MELNCSPLPNPFISNTPLQLLWRILQQQLADSIILPFIVNSLPPINLNTDGSENDWYVLNLPTFFVTLNAGIQDGSPTD
jgi:hypothetical protein